MERSLHANGQFSNFSEVIKEYFHMGHAQSTFYLPMHAVCKNSSTTTKLRAVFNASVKSSTGVSLNDLLLVGPNSTRCAIEIPFTPCSIDD